MRRACYLAVLALLAAGCGGKARIVEQSYGKDAAQVWVFRATDRKPRALVLFFHGLGDQLETTPYHHRPWLRHLAEQGDVVIYPRFELYPGAGGGLRNALAGIEAARAEVPAGLPVVAIGYSRGGGMAVDYAAVASAVGVVPNAVLAVFPALVDPPLDMRSVRAGTRFVFLVGDRDTDVGSTGTIRMIAQLAAARYPSRLVATEIVRSRRGFSATHLSVLDTTAGARAAFWDRADRLIASVARAA